MKLVYDDTRNKPKQKQNKIKQTKKQPNETTANRKDQFLLKNLYKQSKSNNNNDKQ